jgi:hypothetical protein
VKSAVLLHSAKSNNQQKLLLKTKLQTTLLNN